MATKRRSRSDTADKINRVAYDGACLIESVIKNTITQEEMGGDFQYFKLRCDMALAAVNKVMATPRAVEVKGEMTHTLQEIVYGGPED